MYCLYMMGLFLVFKIKENFDICYSIDEIYKERIFSD